MERYHLFFRSSGYSIYSVQGAGLGPKFGGKKRKSSALGAEIWWTDTKDRELPR